MSYNHLSWSVEGEGDHLTFLTMSHPKDFFVWRVNLPLKGALELGQPWFQFPTRWGTNAYYDSFVSGVGKDAIAYIDGLNPDRFPTWEEVLLPSGSRLHLFSCEYAEILVLGGSQTSGEAWIGVKDDCSSRCRNVGLFGFDVQPDGGGRALDPVCPFDEPYELSDPLLLLHPSRREGAVMGLLPQRPDAGVDANTYLRMFEFDREGTTRISDPLRMPFRTMLFDPAGRRLIYLFQDPPPSPFEPEPLVQEIHQIAWEEDGGLTESTFESANAWLRSADHIFEIDEDRWVLVGRARAGTDSGTDYLALLFEDDVVRGSARLDAAEAGGLIRSWRGLPFLFWEKPGTTDGGASREIWTRRLQFEQP